jgi:hypothetical protein
MVGGAFAHTVIITWDDVPLLATLRGRIPSSRGCRTLNLGGQGVPEAAPDFPTRGYGGLRETRLRNEAISVKP